MCSTAVDRQPSLNHFSLNNEADYRHWRDKKLAAYPLSAEACIVEIKDPEALSRNERKKLLSLCQQTNMVIYQTSKTTADKNLPRKLGAQLGLLRLDPNMLADDDGVTSLEIVPGKQKRGYIPYTDKRLLWHTDGYYNDSSHQIQAMLLHCVRPALAGGENSFFDHEMAYLLLREQNPQYIKALMEPDVLTIPENLEANEVKRAAQTGPVFSVNHKLNTLNMRYTARTRSIQWKDNDDTKAALAALTTLLASDCQYIFRHRLEAGQGIICNNVLHNRTSFSNGEADAEKRLIFRARYYDRVTDTAA